MKEGEWRGNIWSKGDEEVTDIYRERLVSDRRFDHAVYLETGWGGGDMIFTLMEA
jgi:hypothetical protein